MATPFPGTIMDEKKSEASAQEQAGVELGHVRSTRIVSNATVVLVPTPTRDELDPLNWSRFQKSGITSIVCFFYFLFTFQTTIPNPAFSLLQEQFDASYTQVNWTFAIPSLGLALGPLFTTAVADIVGRRNVMIAGTIVALIASGCSGITGLSYAGYMACRFFQGFGASPAATVGLGIINDISFEHERGWYIGYWAMAIDLGGLVGGFVGGFLATIDQYWSAYLTAILYAALLIAEFVFLPETLYPRDYVLARDQDLGAIDLKRTKQLGFFNLRPIPGLEHPKPWETFLQFGIVWTYPVVVISVLAYVYFQYWWILSFLTLMPAAYADYSLQVQSLFYIGLILGTIVAEVFCSGKLSDMMMLRYATRHNGERSPENRLWLGYPAGILCSIGLIVWGLSIDREWHWITGQIALFLCLQMGNCVVASYIFDCYPNDFMAVIMYYTVLLNLSAFIEPWYINVWVETSAQAIICTFGICPTYFLLQKFGPRIRPDLQAGKAQ